MKKEIKKSSDGGDAGGYKVGQVSGSLFPEKHKSSALSSLFASTSSANTLVFLPPPKIEPKVTPAVSDNAVVKSKDQVQKQKKKPKTLSAAEKKLQDRESALQNADEEGQASAKKVKRKRADGGEEEEERPTKHKKTVKFNAEERLKMKRTVFVGNLPSSCKKKDLLSVFKKSGVIESVRFRSVIREDPTMSRKVAAIQRKVHPKKQNINAYIVFKEEESATDALKWNGHEIQAGFYIRVDRVSQHSKHDHKRSIFVGNLPYDISELPLQNHFQECGNIEAVRLVRDRDSGMGKGFGYVLFESPDSVMLALKLNGSTLQQRKIRVKRSVKKEKEKKTPPGRKAEGQRTGGGLKGPKQEFRNNTGRKNFTKNPRNKPTQASSFKGEMADPTAKRGKPQKKKFKHKKKKHSGHV